MNFACKVIIAYYLNTVYPNALNRQIRLSDLVAKSCEIFVADNIK